MPLWTTLKLFSMWHFLLWKLQFRIEAIGIDASLNVLEFAANATEYMPIVGVLMNTNGLLNAITSAKIGPETARKHCEKSSSHEEKSSDI